MRMFDSWYFTQTEWNAWYALPNGVCDTVAGAGFGHYSGFTFTVTESFNFKRLIAKLSRSATASGMATCSLRSLSPASQAFLEAYVPPQTSTYVDFLFETDWKANTLASSRFDANNLPIWAGAIDYTYFDLFTIDFPAVYLEKDHMYAFVFSLDEVAVAKTIHFLSINYTNYSLGTGSESYPAISGIKPEYTGGGKLQTSLSTDKQHYSYWGEAHYWFQTWGDPIAAASMNLNGILSFQL